MKFYSWKYADRGLVPAKPGIYILYQDSPIKKIYTIDKKGILYIGEASILKTRLKICKSKTAWQKWYCKNKDVMFNHSLLTFAVDFDNIFNLIAHNEVTGKGLLKVNSPLKLSYLISKKHKETEKRLLIGHMMLFGQLPPFNIKGPSLKSIWESTNTQWKSHRTFYRDHMHAL
jgi:hypothetical protein